jgi:hypothetical protein
VPGIDLHYFLEGHDPKSTDSLSWQQWFKTANRAVARTEIRPGTLVSTVFVGLNLSSVAGEPPIHFETEVIEAQDDPATRRRRRYATWAEAELGHMEMVEYLQARD